MKEHKKYFKLANQANKLCRELEDLLFDAPDGPWKEELEKQCEMAEYMFYSLHGRYEECLLVAKALKDSSKV